MLKTSGTVDTGFSGRDYGPDMQTVLPWIFNFRRTRETPGKISGMTAGGRRKLASRETLAVSPRTSGRIRCISGRVWITDGNGGEAVLGSGESFPVHARRSVVAEALEASVIEM